MILTVDGTTNDDENDDGDVDESENVGENG